MTRQGGAGCKRCGGTKRSHHRHRQHLRTGGAAAGGVVADCDECRDPVCLRHAMWDSARGAYLCTKCERKGKDVPGP